MSQSMRFRLFINQAEGKMWAIGVDTADLESNQPGSWMTMWGLLEEIDIQIGRGYYFSRTRKPKPIDVDAIRRSIRSKLTKGYTEKRDSLMGDWLFVPYPKYGTKQGIPMMLVLESDLSKPVEDRPTVVNDGRVLTLPDAAALDASGYAPIDF